MNNRSPQAQPGAEYFVDALHRLGLPLWLEQTAGAAFHDDPWATVARARSRASTAPARLAAVVALLIEGESVALVDLRAALGDAAIGWLKAVGVVQIDGGTATSALCLVGRPGQLLLADWPRRTRSGGLGCQRTYLSSGSYDCAKLIAQRGATGAALDLGCGGGILSTALGRHASSVTAIDVDPRAIWLTGLNGALAQVEIDTRLGDWSNVIADDRRYDVIVSNPPWRIVPAGFAYPDPIARVGRGADGLDQVRAVLAISSAKLAQGGYAAVRFDLPYAEKHHLLIRELGALEDQGVCVELVLLGEIDVRTQAEVSADTSAAFNPGVADARAKFLSAYASIGVDHLKSVICVLRQ